MKIILLTIFLTTCIQFATAKSAFSNNVNENNRMLSISASDASKHKSWCTFKAWVAKNWRKKNRIFKNDVEKAKLDAANQAQYNLDVANCAQRRLMKEMERNLKMGNSHKGWCSFKNRMTWVGCKSKAAITFDKLQRTANLAACDNAFNLRKAACDAQDKL